MNRKYKEGYTQQEIEQLIKDNNVQNLDKFWGALNGITCMVIDGEVITYDCDIELALRVSKENRDPKWYELD